MRQKFNSMAGQEIKFI